MYDNAVLEMFECLYLFQRTRHGIYLYDKSPMQEHSFEWKKYKSYEAKGDKICGFTNTSSYQ